MSVRHGRPAGRLALPGSTLRYLIGGGALLLAGLVAAFMIVPRLVDQALIERRLAELVTASTGHTLDVSGGVDIKLLPQPLLTVHRPVFGNAATGVVLAADRLDLAVELLPLLVGRLEVGEASLVRPDMRLDPVLVTPVAVLADALMAGGQPPPWQRLRVFDGKLSAAGDGAILENIEALLELNGEVGGSSLTMAGRLAERSGGGNVQLDARLGSVPAGRPVPTQVQLQWTSDSVSSGLEFRGLTRPIGANRGLAGQLSVDLPSPSLLAGLWPAADDVDAALMLPESPVSLEAELSLDLAAETRALRLDEATLVVGSQLLTGAMLLRMTDAPEIQLAVAAERLVLPTSAAWLGQLPLRIARALPQSLSGTVQLNVDGLEWQGQTFRRLAADLRLDGAGNVDISRASAVLPGPGDLAFAGRLSWHGVDRWPELTGRVELALQEPAVLMAVFVEPPDIVRQSTTLAAEAELAWRPAQLTLRSIDVRLDALHAEGALAWRPPGNDRVGQLAVRGTVDRLAMDDYLAADAPTAMVERLLDRLAATDLALDLRVERATFGPMRLGSLVLEIDSTSGQVSVDRASLTDIAGSGAAVTGTINAAERVFDLTLAVDVASLPPLLRLLDLTPAPALSLLGPLNLRAHVSGDFEQASVAATLDADLFKAEASGQLTAWPTAPSGNVTVRFDAVEAEGLVRQLDGPLVIDPLLAGPMTADVALGLERGDAATASLDVTLGSLTASLDARRSTPGSGPLDHFALRLGPLDAGTTDLLYRLATPLLDLVPGPPWAWPGHWPAQELRWDWLWSRDAAFTLSLQPAEPSLPPLEIIGQLRDGALTVPGFRFASDFGSIEAGVALEGRQNGRVADLAIDISGQDLDTLVLLQAIGAPPSAIAGDLDVQARLVSSGQSLRAIVANLKGTIDLVMSDGLLDVALPSEPMLSVGRLSGSLAVERGTVRPAGGGIVFEGPAGSGRIEGSVDLVAWMIELDLALDGHDGAPIIRRRFLGPFANVTQVPAYLQSISPALEPRAQRPPGQAPAD